MSNLLSSCAALTPSVLRLLASITLYLSLVVDLALQPDTRRVRAAEELVGDQAGVHAEPVRELAFGAPHRRQRCDADADRDEAVEGLAQVAGADDLRRIAL